jgi:hypothetical protein
MLLRTAQAKVQNQALSPISGVFNPNRRLEAATA